MIRHHITLLGLLLMFLYVQIFWQVRQSLNPTPRLQAEIGRLSQELKKSHLRELVRDEQFYQFRQDVAALLPQALRGITKKGRDFPLRNMASITFFNPNEKLHEMTAKNLFASASSDFKNKRFTFAEEKLQKLIKEFGYAQEVVKAYYLLAACKVQKEDWEGAQDVINQMVELFPESEMTGFGLISLGEILEARNFYEDALQIYRTVLYSFSTHPTVVAEAQTKLRRMEP